MAINDMRPTKAPGVDGFLALFFQKYWHIVGKEVSRFCLDVLNHGASLEDMNFKNIVLLPNVPNASSMINFRPISLCSVVYKINARMVVMRFKLVLDGCIDYSQSAFVTGRLITNNVVFAYEILHTFGRKRGGRTSLLALKVYMSKAYNRVEWVFLRAMMLKMGFAKD